jgi:hypothetical protein
MTEIDSNILRSEEIFMYTNKRRSIDTVVLQVN